MEKKLRKQFEVLFHSVPLMVKSPGRINLIGEHTDYNNGFVLPAAIDKFILVAIQKRDDDEIHLYSNEFKETAATTLQNLTTPGKQWPVYILGVVDQLQKARHKVGGFNLIVDGDVPIGAGMSSSAAVECASIFALNELFDLGIYKMDMVKMAQKAEHEFARVMCGIMDQFASMFGKEGMVINLDCETLKYEYVPIDLNGLTILLFDSGVKHSLASSEYNVRRQQCETGVNLVQKGEPQVKSLRNVTMPMLEKYVKDELIFKRCKYVVEEIARLQIACEDLKNGAMQAFGKKMFATHEGLKNLYEVSCTELDVLVDAVKNNPDVLGARLMGGGFGGCTINLVKEAAAEEIIKQTTEKYKQQTGKDLTTYRVAIKNGTAVLDENNY